MSGCKLNLAFKGMRKYIQGPDILNQAMQRIRETHEGNLSNIEFLINQMSNNNLHLEFESAEKGPAPELGDIAIVRLAIGERKLQARIKIDAGEPDMRLPYDESAVTNCCQIDAEARGIRLLRDESGFSQIEVLVSMNKALHLAVLDKPADTNWVFCRWSSPEWPLPADLSDVSVTLKQALGTRLTRADVELGGIILGQIYFSAKAAE